jgi:mono/diheme cytochrome c family protein
VPHLSELHGAVIVLAVAGWRFWRVQQDRHTHGQFAQSAAGARQLDVALARGTDAAAAGRRAFARSGLGCASCHGDQAEGLRGPSLAGGRGLDDFRRVHGAGCSRPPSSATATSPPSTPG